jgi:hypothetical protein
MIGRHFEIVAYESRTNGVHPHAGAVARGGRPERLGAEIVEPIKINGSCVERSDHAPAREEIT